MAVDISTGEVRAEVAEVLGYADADSSMDDIRLMDLGLESLTAVELAARLRDRFGVELPPTIAFDAPTIRALAAYLSALRS